MSSLLKGMPRSSVIVLLLVGIGMFSMFAYDYSMKATSTEEFCISCHEMASGPFVLLQDTTHFRNESGVRPTCSDCHIPKHGWPKIWRKIQSGREVWSALTGKIDTPEKYLAHAGVMKNREIARLQANDSQECRNCHDVAAMDMDQQTKMAKLSHSSMQNHEMTCIDCHVGIAHDTLASVHEGGE